MWSASWLTNLLVGLRVICYFTISHQTLPEAGATVPFLLGDKGCMVPMVLSFLSPFAMKSLIPWECASRPCEPQEICQSPSFPDTAVMFHVPHRNYAAHPLPGSAYRRACFPRRQASLSNKDNHPQNSGISREASAPREKRGQYHTVY